MTDDEQDQSNADATPAERARDAMKTAVGELEEAHADADNAAAAGIAEQEQVSAFVDEIARALADGMNQPVGAFAGPVAQQTEFFTKTDLKQQIKDAVEEHRGADKQPLDEFVEERLESVTVVKTTDHRQGAEYIWDFGTFKVETRSGKDGRGHFAFPQFRDLIHESGGVNTAKPVQDRRGGEEWRDFVVDMIDARGDTQYTRGARTKAVEALQNKVKRLTGYGTPESALDHTGIWIVRVSHNLPDWWADLPADFSDPTDGRDLPDALVNEVRVHESVIEPILDDAEITRAAFYHELNARNLTVPGTSGASMSKWVNGSDERFWTLLPDLGTPRTYVPDPNAGVTVRQGSALLDDGQDEQGDETQEATEPVESGADDAQDGGDGFNSVGDTA
ncbi:hypothetical protein [Haloarcula sp. CBA1127]|uniref:hypothetical protein n=1 Tax=Haloarcula sp. CBA1127 TaxID=1765055 RepID=UPI00073F55E0|nr:hypothetical protein [Haloarcula sp. CBA1127]